LAAAGPPRQPALQLLICQGLARISPGFIRRLRFLSQETLEKATRNRMRISREVSICGTLAFIGPMFDCRSFWVFGGIEAVFRLESFQRAGRTSTLPARMTAGGADKRKNWVIDGQSTCRLRRLS
jgi:hypothetical protein